MEKLKMQCRYDTFNDLNARLGHTICRYDDKPVLVVIETEMSGEPRIDLYDPLVSSLVKQIKFDDPLFDISSPELGYVNHESKNGYPSKVYYAIRSTQKKWKQGIHSGLVAWKNIDGVIANIYSSDPCRTPGFIKALNGEYPSLKEGLTFLYDEDVKEIAISQEVAMEIKESGVILIYLRTKNVGFITPGKKKVILRNNEVRWIVEKELAKVGMEISE